MLSFFSISLNCPVKYKDINFYKLIIVFFLINSFQNPVTKSFFVIKQTVCNNIIRYVTNPKTYSRKIVRNSIFWCEAATSKFLILDFFSFLILPLEVFFHVTDFQKILFKIRGLRPTSKVSRKSPDSYNYPGVLFLLRQEFFGTPFWYT